METWEEKLSQVPQMPWADARAIQLRVEKKVEAMRQAQKKEHAATSPLGQRPPLDADHVPLPKGRVR